MEKLYRKYFFNLENFPLAIRRVEGFHLSHEHDYTGKPHYHNFSELVIITKGKGVQSINDKLYPISTGDVFIISGKTIHYFTDYRDLGILNIMFDQSIFESRKDFLRKIPGYNLVFRIEPSLRADKSFSNLLHLNRRQIAQAMEIIEDMENELNTKQSGYEAETAAQFVRLVVFLSRSVKHTEQDKQAFLRLSILLSNLEENYAAPWNLEKMANAVNMSKNNFLRVFKAAEGCSPIRYLNRLRLDAAARLLREKKETISEIAYRCGFQDSNYFTKKFTANFNVSPKKYRGRY